MKPIERLSTSVRVLLIFSVLIIDLATISSQEYRTIPLEHPLGQFRSQGVNNFGQICGNVLIDPDNLIFGAYIREVDGTYRTLTLGEDGISATADAINDLGHVLGRITKADFSSIQVVWDSDSTFQELESPGEFILVTVVDLNNNGEVIGNAFTDPPQAYFWNSSGSIKPLPPGDGGQALALNNNGQIVGRVEQENGGSLPVLWEPDSDSALLGEISFNLEFLDVLNDAEGLSHSARDINDDGLIVGESAIDAEKLNAVYWNPAGIQNVTEFVVGGSDLGGNLSSVNNSGFAIGSHQILLSEGGPIFELGILVDLTDEEIKALDTRQLFEGGTVLPLFLEMNDRFQVLGFDNVSVANFWVGMDPNTSPGTGELGLSTFNSFDNVVIQLEPFKIDPFQVPVIISIQEGTYADDSWTFDKWSVNIGMRGDGEGEALLPQLNIPEGVIVNIEPQVGMTYNIKGISTRGNRLSFFGDVDVDDLEMAGKEQFVHIENPAKVGLNKLKINGADVTVDKDISISQLDLCGTINGTEEDFNLTLFNNGLSEMLPTAIQPVGGAVLVKDGLSGTGGSFSHQISSEGIESRSLFIFPNANPITEDGKANHIMAEPIANTSGSDQFTLSSTSIASPDLETPDFTDGNFVTETISPRVWRIGVQLNWNFTEDETFIRNNRETGITTNFRIPAYDLDPASDPNQYRLFKYDCAGNFMEVAGSFVQPTGEDPEDVIYTGTVDSVLLISHENISLDTCNYFVLATGSLSTSVLTPENNFDFELNNAPNPFSEHTRISYVLPYLAQVDLGLYSLSGQRVNTIVNTLQQAGRQEVMLTRNGASLNLSSGAYVLRMSVKQSHSSDQYYEQSKLIIIE